MPQQDRTILRSYFQVGDRPTEEEFADLIDSMLNIVEDGISTNAGNLGIGTDTPDAPLHVTGGSDVDLAGPSGHIIVGNSNGVHIAIDSDEIMAKADGTTVGALSLQANGGNTHIGGNLGIGITNPSEALDIDGNLNINGAINLINGPYTNRIETDDNGDLVFYMSDLTTVGMRFNPDIADGANGGVLQVYNSATGLGGFEPQHADYAEYFESENAKAIALGTAVAVGSRGKIHPAREGETPIGIVSANPLIVGNNPGEWPGKYLRDDMNQIIMEIFEEDEMVPKTREENGKEEKVLDDKGRPVMIRSGKKLQKQKPKLNPEYDESRAYILREDREEWCCIGLLGQLPLRKGQPTAPAWVKLYEISDQADMWLVK